MSKLVGFAGSIGSGKSTQMRFLHGFVMKNLIPSAVDFENTLIDSYHITSDGKLLIHGDFEDGKGYGELEMPTRNPDVLNYMAHNVWEHIRGFSVAAVLKDLACGLFGVPEECIYGSQEQKLQETHLRWENMPGVITPEQAWDTYKQFHDHNKQADSKYLLSPHDFSVDEPAWLCYNEMGIIVHAPGPMTGREFLQFLGTEVCRKMYGNVWIDACLGQIASSGTNLAIVDDVRFDNEREAMQAVGGCIIYLDRGLDGGTHSSENSMDIDQCNFIVDCKDKTIEQTCLIVLAILQDNDILPMVGDNA